MRSKPEIKRKTEELVIGDFRISKTKDQNHAVLTLSLRKIKISLQFFFLNKNRRFAD